MIGLLPVESAVFNDNKLPTAAEKEKKKLTMTMMEQTIQKPGVKKVMTKTYTKIDAQGNKITTTTTTVVEEGAGAEEATTTTTTETETTTAAGTSSVVASEQDQQQPVVPPPHDEVEPRSVP